MAMNSDSACAAPALLASSLLQRPLEDGKSQAQQITVEHSNWDLNSDITIGIPVISGESSVFASGRVVGISGFQPATHRPQGVRNEDESTVVRNWVLELSTHILITLLTRPHLPSGSLGISKTSHAVDEKSALPQAIVIQFCSNRTYSPEYLFQTLQHKLPDHTTEPFKTIVNSVKLFRVFDLNEILDAISQTSELLHSQKQPSAPTLLLVEGLDQCMKDVQRASSTLSALSKLASLLQTLTVLTRKYATRLTVVIVNSTLCPAAISSLFAPNKEQAGEYTETYSFQQRQQQQQQQSLSHVEEQRISTNPPPATQQQKGPYAPGYHGPSISHLLLESFDTHLLVSKREAKMIIEVAKDRVGGSLGRWCAL